MRRQRQRGVTLIISLIMLVLLTIMALTSFNIGKSSLQVVDNAQQHAQALNAAQTVLNQVVSSATFTESPDNVLDNSACPVSAAAPANSRCVDLFGDGKTVIVVTLTPQPVCRQATPLSGASLEAAGELATAQGTGWGCILGGPQMFGIEGATEGNSLCADSLWEINAAATESVSNAQAVITKGVAMRVSQDSVDTACP